MGHYLSEMYAPWHDSNIESQHNTKWREEISDILESNPITTRDIKIGDKLRLYNKLEAKSKYSYPGYPKHPLRDELHRVMDDMYTSYLRQFDTFNISIIVKDKRKGEVKINVPIHNKLFEPWYDIKYFEKI